MKDITEMEERKMRQESEKILAQLKQDPEMRKFFKEKMEAGAKIIMAEYIRLGRPLTFDELCALGDKHPGILPNKAFIEKERARLKAEVRHETN